MAMSDAFGEGRSRYFVAELRGQVVGGAGVAPLAQGDEGTCELKKMYLASAARGQGVGAVLLDRCLVAARELGYAQCYLETMEEMVAARLLYERRGFRPIATSLGSTGHDICNRWYVMSLEEQG